MKEEFHPVYSYFKPYYRDASILRENPHQRQSSYSKSAITGL